MSYLDRYYEGIRRTCKYCVHALGFHRANNWLKCTADGREWRNRRSDYGCTKWEPKEREAP